MTRVFIGRLPRRCTRRDVEHFFRGYGRILDVVLMGTFGFIEFENYRDADDAVYELNGRDMLSERVVVEHAKLPPKEDRSRRDTGRERWGARGGGGGGGNNARYGPPVRTEYRVVIENLSSRISWQDLKDLMRKAGDVTYADAHVSKRNEGIVEFSSYRDMRSAIRKYNKYVLYGRTLKVREENQNSRSRSRSSSRSRSRSHGRSKRSRTRSTRSRSLSQDDRQARSRSRSYPRNERRKDKRHRRRSSTDRSVSRSRSPRDSKKERSSRMRSHSKSGSRTPSPGRHRYRSQDGNSNDVSDGDDNINHHQSDRHRSAVDSRSRSRSPRHDSQDAAEKERKRSNSASSHDDRSSYSSR